MSLGFFVNTWIFGDCPIEEIISRAGKMGYDGIELVGEPKLLPASKVKPLLDDARLSVTSICGMYPGPEPGDLRYLGHSDERERKNAINYVKDCVDLAVGVRAPSVLVVPGQVGYPSYYSVSKEVDWRWCVESLAEAGEYAAQNNVYLTIEPINRYEVALVNSIDDAINMAKHVDNPYVAVMGDTFHMQMEEGDGIPNAIRKAGSMLRHMHAADNTREAPGFGTMPWREIIRALYDINYQGGLSLEPLPKSASPYDTREGLTPAEVLDSALAFSLKFLKQEDTIVRGMMSSATQ